MESKATFLSRILSMSLSKQIAIGLILGVAVGIFFGEMVTPIRVIADGFVQLLQMTVLPYVTVSLIAGLGSLTRKEAGLMLSKVGGILLLLWALTLGMVFLMPLTFPKWESASFFSTSLVQTRESFDFVSLYIPANPFYSLANNVVPAVVLFSIVVGVALIGVENKRPFLDWLEVARMALNQAGRFVVRLTPIGLFAIGANIAGTLHWDQFQRVQIYLITYSAMALLLTLWLLPGLIAAFTPIRYREVLRLTRDALITAFMTGNLFVVLPILSEASEKLLHDHSPDNPEASKLPEIIVPASFNFPHTGKILSLSFILFAAWFNETGFSVSDHLKLIFAGLLSFFGSLSAAVPYLLDLFRIPIDTFQLFLATGIINSRFGSAIAAMHTLTLAVLGACAMTGLFKVTRQKLVRYITISLCATTVTVFGLHLLFTYGIRYKYNKAEIVQQMQLTRATAPATVLHEPVLLDLTKEASISSQLDRISTRGKLRIGYFSDSLPYSFFNAGRDLVGLDIDMAYQLAGELHVGLEFVAMDRSKIVEQLNAGLCDILMSGFVMSTDRARDFTFSTPYLDEHAAFIVPDYRRSEFTTRESIRSIPKLRVGVPNLPYYIAKVKQYAPEAEFVTIQSLADMSQGLGKDYDVLLSNAERGSFWCLLYPQFSVVVPEPPLVTVPLAYPIARGDQKLAAFLNTWLELKKKDGTIQALYDYWILGKNAGPVRPRWSVIHNVLGWV